MTSQYKKFVKLIAKWPLDVSKGERDLGKVIRDKVKLAFETSDRQALDSEFCNRQYNSLNKLADNYYRNKYKRTKTSTATGLNAEECNVILSNEVLDYLKEENKGLVRHSIGRRLSTEQIEYKGHTPVMLNEAVKYLNPKDDEVYIDMTFGAGGHSRKILETANCRLITLDRDPTAYERAKELAKEYPNRVTPLLGRFSELPKLLKENGISQCSLDGILFDFGCSSMQLDNGERGFSVSKNGYLDMRMDAGREPDQITAREVLATASEQELYKIFKIYGEEKKAAKIAQTIIQARYMIKNIDTTQELVDIVNSCCPDEIRLDKLNRPQSNATKIFQALRIFVNNELNELNYGMVLAKYYLKINGRLVTICFHSLEDTIVKRHIAGNIINEVANPVPLKYLSPTLVQDQDTINHFLDTPWMALNKHVEVPTDEEVERNPRSRSARLRAAIKVK
ncbi:probable methyltransferase-like protein 15 homolog [Amyelois transitella]|uniref:probable methyltransferase-like protein 15 homolog n=1 Tax=Amyelois transitella TaxID=680683 RepID=UPI00067B4B00|nr:probable methyltransferase-like protein 15 homolog [Amyelois transitella]